MIDSILNKYKETGKPTIIEGWNTCDELVEKCFSSVNKTLTRDKDIFKSEEYGEDSSDTLQVKLSDDLYLYNFRGYGLRIGGYDGYGGMSDVYNHLNNKAYNTICKEQFIELYRLTVMSVLSANNSMLIYLDDNGLVYLSENDNKIVDKLIGECFGCNGVVLRNKSMLDNEDIKIEFNERFESSVNLTYGNSRFRPTFSRDIYKLNKEYEKLLEVKVNYDNDDCSIVLSSDALIVKFPYWCGCMNIDDLTLFVYRAYCLSSIAEDNLSDVELKPISRF